MIGIHDEPDGFICVDCGYEAETLDGQDCPVCGGDMAPAYRCEVCDELTAEDEICGYDHNVCRKCVEKKRFDVKFCVEVGKLYPVTIGQHDRGLNGFLASMFTVDEIEELLLNALEERSKIKPVDGISYLKRCASDAADLLTGK